MKILALLLFAGLASALELKDVTGTWAIDKTETLQRFAAEIAALEKAGKKPGLRAELLAQMKDEPLSAEQLSYYIGPQQFGLGSKDVYKSGPASDVKSAADQVTFSFTVEGKVNQVRLKTFKDGMILLFLIPDEPDLAAVLHKVSAESAPAKAPAPTPVQAPKAAPQDGEGRAQFVRYEAYTFGLGVAKDEALALAALRKSAALGFLPGQQRLALSYLHGNGVAKDPTQAVVWMRKAAEQGDAKAQFLVGHLIATGTGAPMDEVQGAAWFRKAADQGLAGAQVRLGACYQQGTGVPKDVALAVAWYRKAAAQGDGNAQQNLGVCYATGAGVVKDAAQALVCYRKAADLGYDEGQFYLGYLYARGEGVTKDPALAASWFRKAADQGHVEAQARLGYSYADGTGVNKDLVLACQWLTLASQKGHAGATKARDEVSAKLTPVQAVEAHLLAQKWKPVVTPSPDDAAATPTVVQSEIRKPQEAESSAQGKEGKPTTAPPAPQGKLAKTLVGMWNMTGFEQRETVRAPPEPLFLELLADQTFRCKLEPGATLETGTWSVNGEEVLVLKVKENVVESKVSLAGDVLKMPMEGTILHFKRAAP